MQYPYFVSPAHEPRGLLSAPGCDDWPPDRALFGKGASGLLAAALGASPPGRSCAPAPAAVTSFVAHAYERGNPWHTLEDVLHMHEARAHVFAFCVQSRFALALAAASLARDARPSPAPTVHEHS